jgi:transposase
MNTKELSKLIGKPYRTVEKWIKKLKEGKKIEFRGSKKKGGYWVVL